ncbi:MAG: hypothetical protein HN494_01105 [Opitutae bacterium]|nr:hypothetical protein [Opitutae bacterium]
MRVFPSSLLSIFAIVLLNGCFYRTASEAPIVYQEWNARYNYDLDNRRLISSFGNKRIGRNWGRNENGLIDYDRWWGRGPLITENLMIARRKDEDAIREKRWIESEKARLKARRKEIEKEAGMNMSKPDVAEDSVQSATDEPVPFIPEPFAPTAPAVEEPAPLPNNPAIPEDPAAPSPFAPMPPDSGLPPLPGGGDGAAPSPFAPLPPL